MSEHCALCLRLMDSVQALLGSGPVCNACYLREFVRVPCATCGAATRSHRGAVPAFCSRCRARPKERCVRCARPVGKNSFVAPGGKACAYCRRYFEPPRTCSQCGCESRHFESNRAIGIEKLVCTRCARKDCETCCVCRKHRKVELRLADGRAVCGRCRTPQPFVCPHCSLVGQRHSAAECVPCYLRRTLAREARLLLEDVPAGWARQYFEVFARDWSTSQALDGRSRRKLRRYARFFAALGESFTSPVTITAQRLVERMGTNGLRLQRIPYAWLVGRELVPEVSGSLADHSAQALTQERLLARVATPWKRELLQRFRRHLEQQQRAWRARGWSGDHARLTDPTLTLLLRAAWRFLEALDAGVLSPQGIDAGTLGRFVVALPGHRNALHAFVSYLNRKEVLFQPLHIEGSGPKNFPYDDLLSPERAAALRQRWLQAGDEGLRNALLGLLVLVYARTATQACSLRKSAFEFALDGTITAHFGPVPVELEPAIGELLRRYVHRREAERKMPLADEEFLFPGLLPGRAFSPAGLLYVLKMQGVTANQLYTTALASFFRAGLQRPKVPVRTLGISDLTAIKYWQAFCPRINDEMRYLRKP